MSRALLHELASQGHRVPIGTHLILHERPNAATIPFDGRSLGGVIAESAHRFETPLAIPLMDLTLEKQALLTALEVPAEAIESFHFSEPPPEISADASTPRMQATCEAIAYVASQTSLLPLGMGIGPFSLMTKLVQDPITPVFLAGSGFSAEDETEIAVLERCLAVGTDLILRYLQSQINAGAKAIIVYEPAANLVYFSPNQFVEDFTIFHRYVMEPIRQIKALLDSQGVELIFHDCGELTSEMVQEFASLDPAMLSLGCSRTLWEDAALVANSTVLYGNLPTKKFYSPQLTVQEVEQLTAQLLENMAATHHPFILGSECDILSVPGSEQEILGKVEAFLRLGR